MNIPRLSMQKLRTTGPAFIRTHKRLLLALVAVLAMLAAGGVLLANPDVQLSVVLVDDANLDAFGDIRENAGQARFRVYLSEPVPSNQSLEVTVNTISGTGANGATGTETIIPGTTDFITRTEVFTFTTGQREKFFTVTIYDDTLDELNESFRVRATVTNSANFSDPNIQGDGGVVGVPATVGATIADDEAPGFNSITPATQNVAEDVSAGTVDFTLDLSPSGSGSVISPQPVTLQYEIAGVSPLPGASPGDDLNSTYPTTGTWTIAANTSATAPLTVTIPIENDLLDEVDETFAVTITAVTNLITGTVNPVGQAVQFTIIDDDELEVSFNTTTPLTRTEGTTVTVEVGLNLEPAAPVTVTLEVDTDSTATEGVLNDFTRSITEVVFSTGETTKTFDMVLNDDTLFEDTETVILNLSPDGAEEGDPSSFTLYIQDNDNPPTISVGDISLNEGNGGGTTDFTFTPTLTATSGVDAVFSYSLTASTATAGTDYVTSTGTLTITAGDITTTVTIAVTADDIFEADETFTLDLTPVSGITESGSDLSATATIQNDDTEPSIAFLGTPYSQEEGTGSISTTFTLTPTLVGATEVDATFAYTTTNDTAVAPGDYAEVLNRTATITASEGLTLTQITVLVAADSVLENDETFTVTLAPTAGITTTGSTLTTSVEILNDDSAPTISIDDVSADEGNGGGTTIFTFTAELTRTSEVEATFDYSVLSESGDTAADTGANRDYAPVISGSKTIPALSLSVPITVEVVADDRYENDETFTVVLTPTAGITSSGSDLSGLGTIENDDAAPAISIDDISQIEGTGGTTTFIFTPTLSAVSGLEATFAFTTTNGTALAPDDYTAVSNQTGSIAAGSTTTPITVSVVADDLFENNETFTVTLNPTAGITTTGSDLTATATITDDDTAPTISISNISQVEGTGGTTTFIFTPTLSAVSGVNATFAFTTTNGTALAPADYTAVSNQTGTISAGNTTTQITVSVVADSLFENNETFTVTLNPTAGITSSGSDLTTTATIQNDDTAPTISIGDISQVEGTGGTTTFIFTPTLSAVSGLEATFAFTTTNGTALAPDDYTAVSNQTGTISAGNTTTQITVSVVADDLFENNETFTVTLNPTAGITTTGSDLTATATITDDDTAPTISISNISQVEGTGGTTTFIFTPTLSAVSGVDATFAFTTTNGTALTPADYAAVSNQEGSIAAGSTTTQVTVSVVADSLFESNETFTVTLNPTGGITGGEQTATATIEDDDSPPTISIDDVSADEGDPGDTTIFTFTAELTRTSAVTATFDYSVVAGSATAGVDYTPASGSKTIPALSTTVEITVAVTPDLLYESDETFTVVLTPTAGITSSGSDLSGLGTIENDDDAPTMGVGNITEDEGSGGGTTDFTFTPTLSETSGVDAVFSYSLTAGTATADTDYIVSTGTVTITAGDTSEPLTVQVVADDIFEADETFTLNLTLVSGITSTGSDLTATATIQNDDTAPSLTIGDATVTEGDSGTVNANFVVTLSAVSGISVTVDYATADGTATVADNDYIAQSNTLTINAEVLTGTITVPVRGDTRYEPDETFVVNLSDAVSGEEEVDITDDQGTGTIIDDDQPTVQFERSTSTVAENGGTATITVTLTTPVVEGEEISVPFSVIGGTATGGGTDYSLGTTSPLVFNEGEDVVTITVNINSDALDEANETVIFELGNSDDAAPGSPRQHTLTIQDDDPAPAIDFSSATSSVNETDATATIPVTLSAASGLTVTVNYAAADIDATIGVDYDLANGSLTFPPGSTSQDIVVDIYDDEISEMTEQVEITLSNAANATLPLSGTGNNPHTLDIIDDEAPPNVEFILTSSSVDENADPGTIDIGVRLTRESSSDITVDYAVSGGNAVAGTDYVASTATGQLEFPAGTTEQTFTVSIIDNEDYQLDRRLVIELSDPTGGETELGANTTHTLTIEDDDGPTVNFEVATASIQEGDPPGQRAVTVTLVLDEPILTGETVTIQLQVSGTAQSDDFVVGDSVVFNSGDSSKPRVITISGDNLDELDETVILTIQIPEGENLDLGTPNKFTLTIQDDDETPVAVNDTYTVDEDTPLNIPVDRGMLANDTDGDDDTLTVNVLTQPTHGTLTFNADGSFTYAPELNFFGTDTFTYNASDGTNTSNVATVTITVNSANDAPIAVDDRAVVVSDAPSVIDVLANDTDVENNTLTVSQVTQPDHGQVAISNGGANVTYTPATHYLGADQFTYTVCDNGTPQKCDTATVSITVSSGTIYLPFVSKGVGPDLVVTMITTDPSPDEFRDGSIVDATAGKPAEITVVIQNQGTDSTNRQFWVDLYMNPVFPDGQSTPQVNDRWNDLCPTDADPYDPCYYGIVWLVDQILAPGESITLTSKDIAEQYSNWPGYFISGTDDLYVQVDSWNPDSDYGAISEQIEANNVGTLLDLDVSGNNPFLQAELRTEIPERP